MAFQAKAYTEGIGYRVQGFGVIGGETDREVMRRKLNDFSNRIAEEVKTFCARSASSATMQEPSSSLAAGAMILLARDAIITAAQTGGTSFVKIHAPWSKTRQGYVATGP